ncbi:MAG: hypothetical protein QXT19_03450 [Candidatus Woesearchaeota archaeon]
MIAIIMLGYAKIYPYLHEFGHSATAVIFALGSGNENLTLSWVYGDNGPKQTRITTKLNPLSYAFFSLGGGLIEILSAYIGFWILKKPKVKILAKWRDWSANIFLICFVLYAIFVSIIFADTDGLALGPKMQEKLGTIWGILSTTIQSILLIIGTAGMISATTLDIVPFFIRKQKLRLYPPMINKY